MTSKYRLVVVSGVQAGQSWEDCPREFTVGSEPSCDLILVDCLPQSRIQLSVTDTAVLVSQSAGEAREIGLSQDIQLSEQCKVKLEVYVPAVLPKQHQVNLSAMPILNSKALKLLGATALGSFVISAAIASDFLGSSIKPFNLPSAKLEKPQPISNFDRTNNPEQKTANSELEKRFGCAKECFSQDQIAAIFAGQQGMVQMKDGRKLKVGASLVDGVSIEAIGENYVLFTDGTESVRVDVF
jgi:hypothetical protein